MKLLYVMIRMLIPLILLILTFMFSPQETHATTAISAQIIGASYELAALANVAPPPHSICSKAVFYGEVTLTGASVPTSGEAGEKYYMMVFAPLEGYLLYEEFVVGWGQTRTFPFSIDIPLYSIAGGLDQRGLSSYPFTVGFSTTFSQFSVYFQHAILLDPIAFEVPCFDGMIRATPWGNQVFEPPRYDGPAFLGDGRLNANADARVVIYPRPDGGIIIYGIDANSRGYTAIVFTAQEIADLPSALKENRLVERFGNIALYKLISGEYQVNVGLDVNGTVQVYILDPTLTMVKRRADFNLYSL